jgi:hypothetical protein
MREEIYQTAVTSGRLSAKAISDVAIAAVVSTYRLLWTGTSATPLKDGYFAAKIMVSCFS